MMEIAEYLELLSVDELAQLLEKEWGIPVDFCCCCKGIIYELVNRWVYNIIYI